MLNYKIYSHNFQLGFQKALSPNMEGIVNVHYDILTAMIGVLILVGYLLTRSIYLFNSTSKIKSREIIHHDQVILEVTWTILPIIILFIIGVPSIALLYASNELVETSLTIKVIGNQWYWTYEYSDLDLMFDSYMVAEEDLNHGELRLLEVDHRLILPSLTHVKVLMTSADVIHSWAIPSLGIKIDACPGRINSITMFMKKVGIYYGQCSEICGVNHGFMPIVVQAVNELQYVDWVNSVLKNQ
uniref:Cytochrome c oxidase subunit 2 n=1 Tax=Pharyngomonas kirbyi TaxID=63601 RepID=A0A1W6R257_9EUKA|nr:cytochrome c oxidase subunit 2 [Pharyngomonas kirbyi]ARO47975.1 cytochrome c oxidase subunit 2 [Pharyngomonas kirbyi]